MRSKDELLERLLKDPVGFSKTDFMELMDPNADLRFPDLRKVTIRLYDLNENSLLEQSNANAGVMGYLNKKSTIRRRKRYDKLIKRGYRFKKDAKVILAEGDSWFQFPVFLKDIIDWLAKRDDYVIKEIKNSDKIFVSSHQVKKEFKKYYNLSKTIIPLKIPSNKKMISFKKNKNFILFPAQFWEHKNHKFLIQASEIIKKRKLDIRFYLCGKVENYKNNTYFDEINNSIKNKKLEKIIINLGEVSKNKLEELQDSCIAFVNPSLNQVPRKR